MTDVTFAAFLFTDIEGSSLKWLNHRAAMQGALADHDRLLRAAIATHEGEIFKTAGDAFFAAFKRPSDAVNAAIAAQKEIACGDWAAVGGLTVRMAVHCGTAEKRDGDYFGPALNRCARLLVLGHGGQILTTAATAELLASEREVKEPLREIGTHPLDDPAQPVGIHQVLVDGLPQDFPQLRAPEAHATNLPRHLTPLIGRKGELEAVKQLIANNRLVTLTGPGGVGKTRLAIEAGSALQARFPQGVWLVELAPLTEPSLVVSAVGKALRLDLSGNRAPSDILVGHLESQDALIVLDNCEHLVEAVAALVEAILGGTSRVRILTSTQEVIGVPGEQVFRVASLALPQPATPLAADAIRASAVQLFVERVRSADPSFAFNDNVAPIVAGICKRLDGIALAIEMAAARTPALGLEAIAQGLDDRFRLLTAGKRTALPRQRTLHAALDWSHALLNERDRVVFRRAGHFAGGFTLKAAIAVIGDETLDEAAVIDCIADLVAKSLVVAEAIETRTRFRLLETTRTYALERLGEVGEADATARRHAAYFRSLFEVGMEEHWRLPTAQWHSSYASEIDNLRAALEWSFGPNGDAEIAIPLAAAGNNLFQQFSLFDEGKKWLETAQQRVDAATPRDVQAHLACAWGMTLVHGGFWPTPEAIGALQRAATLCREVRDERYLSFALLFLGLAHANRGEVDAANAALVQARPLIDDTPLSAVLYYAFLGMLKMAESDLPAARSALERSIELGRDAGTTAAHFSEMALGMLLILMQDSKRAAVLMRDLLERVRKAPFVDARRMLGTTAFLSHALADCGEHREAIASMREAASLARTLGVVPLFFERFAYILATASQVERAARLAGWNDERFKSLKVAPQLIAMHHTRTLAILNERLTRPELERLMAEGAAMSEAEACRLVEAK